MIIVKIGGGAGIDLGKVVEDLAKIEEEKIIIHGANALRDELAKKTGYQKQVVTSISGYSSVLTDEQGIDVMMMAYAGVRNKRLVEMLQQQGINAVGLSGLDGKVIQGKRNAGIRVQEGEKKKILRDSSGKPKSVNAQLLHLLLDNGYTPVLCVPIIDENNCAINSENDDIVAVLQAELKARAVVQLIEAPGFLEDSENPDSVVARMSKQELLQREEQVKGRMKRKMLALRKLFDKADTTVYISDGRIDNPVSAALEGKGTTITA